MDCSSCFSFFFNFCEDFPQITLTLEYSLYHQHLKPKNISLLSHTLSYFLGSRTVILENQTGILHLDLVPHPIFLTKCLKFRNCVDFCLHNILNIYFPLRTLIFAISLSSNFDLNINYITRLSMFTPFL